MLQEYLCMCVCVGGVVYVCVCVCVFVPDLFFCFFSELQYSCVLYVCVLRQ